MHHKRIVILSEAGDLHALAVASVLNSYPDTHCRIVETNRLSGAGSLSWSYRNHGDCFLPGTDGEIPVRDIDVIWWRRVNAPQKVAPEIDDPAHLAVIQSNCRAALRGILEAEFRGVWVSEPHATDAADNKVVQLRAAGRAGFRIPPTLVSQDPARIRDFCRTLDHQVVVKAVQAARSAGGLVTGMVTDEILASEESMRLCAAIYQWYVPGRFHIRAHCFGDQVHAALLESERLDWRIDHTTPMKPWDAPADVVAKLRSILRLLGVRMGIVDLKLDEDGQPVWLELNPQGQFLFAEAGSGLPLTELLAQFLRQQAAA